MLTQKIISYASGIRGIEIGIKNSGFPIESVLYLERDTELIANLLAQMENSEIPPCPIYTDIRKFEISPFKGKVHGFVGGYPCTPFTVSGSRGGSSSKNYLWTYILRDLQAARPIWAFFENVDSHLTFGWQRIQRQLFEAGYIVEVGLYSTREAGGSILRKRIFFFVLEVSSSELYRREFSEFFEKKRGKKYKHSFQTRTRDTSTDVSIRSRDKGHTQYPHEPSRRATSQEIKSLLGCPDSGSSYREELIRIIGNTVDPRTAEMAWVELNLKMIDNQK